MPTPCFAPPGGAAGRAVAVLLGAEGERAVAVPGPAAALARVADGIHDCAVVPFEDSHEGTATATLDALVFDVADLAVTAEADLADDGRTTRWVVVRPFSEVGRPPADARLQTLLFAVPHVNRPGVLTEMLAAFSSRGINVGRFEPRPLHAALGMYGFLLEVEGSPGDPWLAQALADLLAATSTVIHLGTFPAGERAWSTVSGRSPAGRGLHDRTDLEELVAAWS